MALFGNLDDHCSLAICKQVDFLPFRCDMCHKTFCLEHRKYSDHNCEHANKKSKQAVICPLCNQPVTIPAGVDENQYINDHIDQGCQRKKKITCAYRGCKVFDQTSLTECKVCLKKYCLTHRYPDIHICTKPLNTNQKPKTIVRSPVKKNSNKPKNSATNKTNLAIKLPNGDTLRSQFFYDTTLREVAEFVEKNYAIDSEDFIFKIRFPPKTFNQQNFNERLNHIGCTPSGTLIVHPTVDHKAPPKNVPQNSKEPEPENPIKSFFNNLFK